MNFPSVILLERIIYHVDLMHAEGQPKNRKTRNTFLDTHGQVYPVLLKIARKVFRAVRWV